MMNPNPLTTMNDALAKAREIAARLSGAISDLGKRKYEDDGGGNKRKKIYIPRDNPDINFLGLLIGPKGVTQKHLQESTGAKIVIRGRGAAKDGGPSNTGHSDDTDDLHVCIEGSEISVDRATKEIEQILYNPEQAVKLKQQQLQQLAELSGGNDVYGPGGGDSYQLEISVPNNMVGLVIGKGGENILRIQMSLGVHAQIAKESEMLPGETNRRIVLKGNPNAVAEAKQRIEDIVASQIAKLSGGKNQEMLGAAFVVKLPVPNDKVGIIIGKGGATIKGIQDRTHSNVQIPPGPDEGNPQVRTLSIGGDSKESVDTAQMEIAAILQQNQPFSSGSTMSVIVPDDRVGIIIGKGGATVKDIQNRLQVRIQIPHSADLGTNPPVRTLSVQGSAEGQAMAKYEIEMIVAGTPVNPADPYDPYGYSNASGGSTSSAAIWGGYAGLYGSTYAAGYGATGYESYYGTSGTADQGSAAASTEDPTSYYADFWQYASYYGEAAARLYYQAWSPPVGTSPPAGMTIPPDPAGDSSNVQSQLGHDQPTNGNTKSANASDNDAWEQYRKQYAEWYEAHGKAAGADPNPPSM